MLPQHRLRCWTIRPAWPPFRSNQQAAPGQFVNSGVYWNDLGGSYQIDSGTLVVQLTDAPVGRVNADAVRIERIFDLGGVNSLEGDGFGIGSINSFEPGVADCGRTGSRCS